MGLGFLNGLCDVILGQARKCEENYDKGYDKAEKLSDEQIKARINSTNISAHEKMGMAQAYKDRH